MAGIEVLPKEYGYVVLIISLAGFLNFWMAAQVSKARTKYNVPYPALYASEDNKNAKLFNCIQRGHQNSLEFLPLFLTFMVVGGIKHPIISAALGFVYVVARYFYFTGYSTGDPKKRYTIGNYSFLAIVGLNLCAVYCGISFLLA